MLLKTGGTSGLRDRRYDGHLLTQSIQFTSQRSAKADQVVVEVLGLGQMFSLMNALAEIQLTGNSQQQLSRESGQKAENTAADDSVVGTWKGELEGNGEMTIKSGSNGYDVSLSVSGETAGGTSCHGAIDGSAALNGNALVLTKRDDDVVCTVTIVFSGGKAELTEGDGCGFYHGAACSFEGTLEKSPN